MVPRDPISKKPITKRAGRVTQGIGPEFKPQYRKKKKKRKKKSLNYLRGKFLNLSSTQIWKILCYGGYSIHYRICVCVLCCVVCVWCGVCCVCIVCVVCVLCVLCVVLSLVYVLCCGVLCVLCCVCCVWSKIVVKNHL
jgi:hypothetical protein